jgi:hypothetical protein
LLIAALSWILLTRGIVDDQKCSAGVLADEGKEDGDNCKNKLQFVYNG